MLIHPENQFLPEMLNPLIDEVAIEMLKVDYGKGQAQEFETYRSAVTMMWLQEMAPAGKA
jgi:hypothetical protein